ALAKAHGKTTVAGSDSHTYRGIGRTYMVCDNARNREEFMSELRQGRVRVEGREGGFFTLSSDITRLTARFYLDGLLKFVREPLDWKRQLMVLCSTMGLPLLTVGFAAAFVHFIQDRRYNDELLLDIVSRSYDDGSRPSPALAIGLASGD